MAPASEGVELAPLIPTSCRSSDVWYASTTYNQVPKLRFLNLYFLLLRAALWALQETHQIPALDEGGRVCIHVLYTSSSFNPSVNIKYLEKYLSQNRIGQLLKAEIILQQGKTVFYPSLLLSFSGVWDIYMWKGNLTMVWWEKQWDPNHFLR